MQAAPPTLVDPSTPSDGTIAADIADDLFGFGKLYETRPGERSTFGAHWCGPDTLTREWTVCARYPKSPADGDGQDVEIDCCALPTRFYRLRAAPSPNSVGAAKMGFALTTGSGMDRWAATTAELIAEGMVGMSEVQGELLDAAETVAAKLRGHHVDTCSRALVAECACDCGADALRAAIAKARGGAR